jgi:IS1 family transposase
MRVFSAFMSGAFFMFFNTAYYLINVHIISRHLLIQTKAEMHGVERDNFRQRHWFARFRRKACVVSRSQQMVDLTMALYAKFWVNSTFTATTLFS